MYHVETFAKLWVLEATKNAKYDTTKEIETNALYDTYISEKDLLPIEFIRDVDEGGYLINRHVFFDHNSLTAKDSKLSLDSSITINPGTQDLLSAFYYLRCLDVSDLNRGDKIQLTIFMDHENYPFQLK